MANKTMYYALIIGAKVAKFIPRTMGHKMLGALGYGFGLLPHKGSKNLKRIHKVISPNLSENQYRFRAANVYSQYARYWWDVFWLSVKRTPKEINKIVSAEGFEKIEKILQDTRNSKGIIFVLPHIGSWELAGAWIANKGYQPLVVAERLKPPELFELFTSTRNQAGMEVIAHDDNPSSKLLAGLEDSAIVCLVADRDMSKRGITAEFFGKQKTFPAGPAVLSHKAQVSIIPVCAYLSRNSKITLVFDEAIEPSADGKSDIEEITAKIANSFEKMISKDPEQWHVLQYEWLDK